MKRLSVRVEDAMLEEVEKAAAKMGVSRSAFVRGAIRSALDRLRRLELETKQREGYLRHPVRPGEFDVWEAQQVWVD